MKQHELVVTITFVLGEAPDSRELRECGIADLNQYALEYLEEMALGDLADFELTISAKRRAVKEQVS